MVSYDTKNKGGHMPTSLEITEFLEQVKASIDGSTFKILAYRRKYLSTLAQLGIVEQDVLDDIKNLTVNEKWIKEPDDNPSYPGDVWKCKKYLHGVCIYIKLKIMASNGNTLLVMSYHIDGI